MAKRSQGSEEGEQLALIEVEPENAKELLHAGRVYNRLRESHASQRERFRTREQIALEKFLAAIEAAGVAKRQDGSYRFTANGELIIVTPKLPKVKIKPFPEGGSEEDEDEEEDEEQEDET